MTDQTISNEVEAALDLASDAREAQYAIAQSARLLLIAATAVRAGRELPDALDAVAVSALDYSRARYGDRFVAESLDTVPARQGGIRVTAAIAALLALAPVAVAQIRTDTVTVDGNRTTVTTMGPGIGQPGITTVTERGPNGTRRYTGITSGGLYGSHTSIRSNDGPSIYGIAGYVAGAAIASAINRRRARKAATVIAPPHVCPEHPVSSRILPGFDPLAYRIEPVPSVTAPPPTVPKRRSRREAAEGR